MIKINLIGQKKSRRVRGGGGGGGSAPVLLLVIAGGVLVLVLGFFLVHRPLSNTVADLKHKNGDLKRENDALKKETKNSRAIRDAFESALARQQATARLKQAQVTPAWFLFELSNILTPGHQPQLTPEMQAELQDNPNRPWQEGWDPKHVWITSFEDKDGHFKLRGGAQSKGDVIELGLRLRASMFFDDVSPTETDDVVDKDSGLTYHKFSIEGDVRY